MDNNLVEEYEKKNHELEELVSQRDDEIVQLNNILQDIPGDIYWKDKNGVWTGLNKRCAESLYQMGFIKDTSLKSVIGKTDYQIFDKATADNYRQNDLEVMEKKVEIAREEKTILPSGEKVTLLSTKRPLLDKRGNVIGIIGNTINISNLKKIEKELKIAKERAEAANEAKTAFLENMRHDIRTPLTGITGFAKIISEEVTEPRIKEYADNLRTSSDALLDLLNEILEIININAGEHPVLHKKFNLNNRLEEVINLYKAKMMEKKLTLTTEFDPLIPRYLIGDSFRIHRIVLELIANAFNFTNHGFVTLRTQLAKDEGKRLIIKITVQDSGIGIAPEEQEEIFIQFKKLTPSYKTNASGAGIGLTIVKRFVDDLDGELYLESKPDVGSVFTVILPIKKALLDEDFGLEKSPHCIHHHDSNTSVCNTTEDSFEEMAKKSILIVEDSPIAAKVAKLILEQLNCSVDIAIDGKTALELIQTNKYALIFMDIGLPDIDGIETTRRIRLQESNCTPTPIIALTAHLDESKYQNCLKSGMNAVLTKPLTKEKAQDILNKYISFHITGKSL